MVPTMTPDEYCQQKAAQSGSSFYYSFMFLPPERRRAITALYAFCREVDDAVDEASDPQVATSAIAWWRTELGNLYAGKPNHPVTRALAPVLEKFDLRREHMEEIIEGMEMDLHQQRYADFAALNRYCYCVAGAVGLLAARIFGYTDPKTLEYAEKLGLAFQLTNIIRDVREDYENGRVYLPAKDLVQFGVEEQALRGPTLTPALRSLLAFEAGRARQYFIESAPLVAMTPSIGRKSLRALIAVYSQLLDKIVDSGYEVLGPRVRLPLWRKLWILVSNAI